MVIMGTLVHRELHERAAHFLPRLVQTLQLMAGRAAILCRLPLVNAGSPWLQGRTTWFTALSAWMMKTFVGEHRQTHTHRSLKCLRVCWFGFGATSFLEKHKWAASVLYPTGKRNRNRSMATEKWCVLRRNDAWNKFRCQKQLLQPCG